jgi:exopolyphosphatase / guanosine-5'-triphosphate,3'-diphosphate pyrophosphatase
MSGPRAAVDIGSTSTRLLVVGSDDQDRERVTTVTRLGDGVGDRGALDPARTRDTLAALGDFRQRLDRHGVERTRAVATSSLRRASDGDAFLDQAADVLGVRPEVIGGEEEGRLSFVGATARLDPAQGPFVVIDLGGGSCEFVVEEATYSAEFGAARLTERWLRHDPPRPEELTSCLSVIETHLEDVRRELVPVGEANTWVGLGGTITTFAAVELGLEPYDRNRINGFALGRAAAEDVYRTLVTEPLADRLHNPGLPADRAEVILGGACAVVAIMRFFALGELVISDAGLLDGVVAGLVGTD